MLTALGCHHAAPADALEHPDPAIAAPPGLVLAADRTWQLGASGAVPGDTTVTFPARAGRTVVLRHAPPDGAIFAIVAFPPDTTQPGSGDAVQVTIHPLPEQFAISVATPNHLAPGATATFSYAKHFAAPAGATAEYGSAGRYEQALTAARRTGEGQLEFLASSRPGADMIRFALTEPGTYLLVAPR